MKILRLSWTSLISAIIVGALTPFIHRAVNDFFMGFFRDLSRLKAKKRRMGNDKALSVTDFKMLVFKIEDDPLEDMEEDESALENLPIYSRKELFEYGTGKDGNPILLALFGRVYDVSNGEKFYGIDGKYSSFAGRDVTRALSTGCLSHSCLGSIDDGENEAIQLNEKSKKEGHRWVSFFETHDSYAHVGMLSDARSIEDLIDDMVNEEAG
jgi:membrane-associated progesterone receptor component